MASQPPRYVCILCKRKFKTAALLTRHKQLSELHRKNFVQQDDDMKKQKEELRQSMGKLQERIQNDEVPKHKRTLLEEKHLQLRTEYGQVQEKLEASRLQRMVECSAGSGTIPKMSEARELQLTAGVATGVDKLQLSAGVASWQGGKDFQEDRYIIDIDLEAPGGKRVVGFCVMDGHSGTLCVDALVKGIPGNLQKCLAHKNFLTEENLKAAVMEACALTENEFLAKAREREVNDGSTMVLCLVFYNEGGTGHDRKRTKEGYKILIANVGDSRAVLCRSLSGKNIAHRLSDDHKPGRDDERRRIALEGGVVNNQGVWRVYLPGPANFAGQSNLLWGLAVSRAFGDILMKEPKRYGVAGVSGPLVAATPEIKTWDLQPTEDMFLILACDGVWDVLSDDDATAVCAEKTKVDVAAQALVRRAFELGSDDNITALVVKWQTISDELGGEAGESKRART